MTESSMPVERPAVDRQMGMSWWSGLTLSVLTWSPGWILAGLTKDVLKAGMEAELSDRLGYETHDPAGRNTGNFLNRARSKTVYVPPGPGVLSGGRCQRVNSSDASPLAATGLWVREKFECQKSFADSGDDPVCSQPEGDGDVVRA